MRIFLAVLVLLVGGALALWQFDVIELPSREPPVPPEVQATTELFNAVKIGDTSGFNDLLALGADVNSKDQYGQTPLMYAVSEGGNPNLVDSLLREGADVNAQSADGWTALMYAARDAEDLQIPIFLLNAGADPTLRTTEGQSVLDVAGIPIRSSPLYRRMEAMLDKPFNQDWPSGYVVPVQDATISSRASHLPGAPRAYRNGTHEGFDFYGGTVSVPIRYGTPVVSVAAGRVIRADTNYTELTQEEYDGIIEASQNSLITPPEILDQLRGRQVWVQHAGDFVSRYAHLAEIPSNITEGAFVAQGDTVGTTGNSGTIEAVQGSQDGPHPHVEIWKGEETYLGFGLEPEQIYVLAEQVFGARALPPYTE